MDYPALEMLLALWWEIGAKLGFVSAFPSPIFVSRDFT
jgi:hypothetical protein